jgi:16S rRNA C967 or C1407 C5-methylase (RsmB/RsmF family)/NOL1/NOP2/fmu family ribosome biogenesis protein
MFPGEFIQRLATQQYIDKEQLLSALGSPSPASIRINRAKWDLVPRSSSPVPWSDHGFYLESRPSFTSDPLFHAGCYYPQEASGMFAGQALRQIMGGAENIRVLDLCGAPGGKSLVASDVTGPGSLLVSNEVIRQRSAVLAETMAKWGSGKTIVTNSDPSVFGRLEGFFDVIIADAPCSGEGMFRNEVAVNEWSAANTMLCAERQQRILMDAWPALKENGVLIYSTCTFNPAENEENMKWLSDEKNASAIRLDISAFPGITEISCGNIFGYGFYPGRIKGEGFFLSALRKTESAKRKTLKSGKLSFIRPTGKEKDRVMELADTGQSELLKFNDEIYAIPCDYGTYSELYGNLRIISPGTKLFKLKNNDFIPAHEFALSGIIRKDSYPRAEMGFDPAIRYLQREAFSLHDAKRGWNLVTCHGVPLGFVNNIGNRVNNYYPVDWRIRMKVTETAESNIIKWEDGRDSGR